MKPTPVRPTPPLGKRFNTDEAAEYLGITMAQLRWLITTQKIKTMRDGRVRIYQRWCDEYVASRSRPVAAPAPSKDDQPRRRSTTETSTIPPAIAALMPAERKFPRAS